MGEAPRRELASERLRRELNFQVPEELARRVREAAAIRAKILKCLEGRELTVREIAREAGIPESVVFWHLMTMYKYNLVEPAEKTEDGFYKYRLKRGR
jgi:DNA-binding transcriptional ArsR family regulator